MAVLVPLAGFPTPVAVQPVDPTAVVDVSGPVRAVGVFLIVFLFGAAVLSLFEASVDRSIDAWMDRPLLSAVYGLLAQVVVAIAVAYAYSLVAGGGPVVVAIGLTVVAVAWVVAASFGFVVVGGGITEIAGDRQPWIGLVFGAGVAAVVWLVSSFVVGMVVWLVVSLGIGGRTRQWVHASRSVDRDTGSSR